MEEITWDDVKKGMFLVVRQAAPVKGPRKSHKTEWCGQITEHNQKWTRIKHDRVEMTLPTLWGEEEILKCTKAEFNKYVKDNYG